MFSLSSEKRARHRFIDRTLEATNDFLDHPVAAAHLGEITTDRLKDITNRLYVPNVRHNNLILPRDSGERIPLLALAPGESVMVPPEQSLPSPSQRAMIHNKLAATLPNGELLTRNVTDSLGKGYERPMKLSMPMGAKALVAYDLLPFSLQAIDSPDAYEGFVRSRPSMALSYRKSPRVSPTVLVHEFEHITQGGHYPIVQADAGEERYRTQLRYELGAYNIQRFAIEALVASGYHQLPGEMTDYEVDENGMVASDAMLIDHVRGEVNAAKSDMFFPDDKIIRNLADYGLDIVGKRL